MHVVLQRSERILLYRQIAMSIRGSIHAGRLVTVYRP